MFYYGFIVSFTFLGKFRHNITRTPNLQTVKEVNLSAQVFWAQRLQCWKHGFDVCRCLKQEVTSKVILCIGSQMILSKQWNPQDSCIFFHIKHLGLKSSNFPLWTPEWIKGSSWLKTSHVLTYLFSCIEYRLYICAFFHFPVPSCSQFTSITLH